MSSLPRHRTVADVMTARVHMASPHTPFKLLVRLLEENRISAVPVVDQLGVPVGVVSESDLLHKERWSELEEARGPLHIRQHRGERMKAEGVVAEDLMTSPAITVALDTPLSVAARMMQQRNVRRLVVVDARGRIAGIATRSDLLQVFLRSDEDLREELVERIIPAVVPVDANAVEVDVEANVITLTGEVDRKSDADILARVSREVDGVVDVVNRLRFRWDDTRRHAPAL